jgi:hypothetical protein
MRCQDVTRELSAPTGRVDPAVLVEHVGHCARCAAWSRRSNLLDRLWEQTQPVEPDQAADRVWHEVAARLDAPAPGASRHQPQAPAWTRQRWLRAAACSVSAAAAAIVAMALFAPRPERGGTQDPPVVLTRKTPPATAPAATLVAHHVEVDAGHPVWIQLNDGKVEVEHPRQLSADELNLVAADFDMFNTLEALAQQ